MKNQRILTIGMVIVFLVLAFSAGYFKGLYDDREFHNLFYPECHFSNISK